MQKYLLQTLMLVYPEGLEVLILVRAFIYIHTMCVRAAKAQVGLHLHVCADYLSHRWNHTHRPPYSSKCLNKVGIL